MHYVMSDIHGQYGLYKEMLRKINFSGDDDLYILGDVIDRGPRPVDILLHALKTPNIHLLMGNHEAMMLEAFHTNVFYTWSINGCHTTLKQLGRLSQKTLDWIIESLPELPLVIPSLQVGNQSYYLVHACPIDTIIEKPILYKDASVENRERALWERKLWRGVPMQNLVSEQTWEHYREYKILVGHTPVQNTKMVQIESKETEQENGILYAENGHLINLDCGCTKTPPILGCLCLETGKEYYVI